MALNVATPEATLRLLRGRLAVTGRGEEPFTVAELLDKFLPYRLVRSELGLDTKPEYDLSILRLLDSERLERSSLLAEAVSAELDRGEPTIEFLSRLGEERLNIPGLRGASPAGSPGRPAAAPAAPSAPPAPSAPVPSTSASAPASVPADETVAAGRPCRGCERTLPQRDGLRFCPFCGRDQTVARCAACGEQVDEAWAFCPRCGRKVLT